MTRPRAFLAAVIVALGLAAVLAGPASAWHEDYAVTASAVKAGNLWFAAEPDATAPGTVGGITLSALAVTGLVSVLLPIVTGLLTKYRAPAIVKGLTSLAVSAVHGTIMGSLAVDGSAHIARAAIVLALVSFVIQAATYLGVYQPLDANARLLPDVGLGREDPSR